MKKLLMIASAAVALLAAAGLAAAAGFLDGAKPATARFHDLDQAVAAGYSFRLPERADLGGRTCIAQPGSGAMGVQFESGSND